MKKLKRQLAIDGDEFFVKLFNASPDVVVPTCRWHASLIGCSKSLVVAAVNLASTFQLALNTIIVV